MADYAFILGFLLGGWVAGLVVRAREARATSLLGRCWPRRFALNLQRPTVGAVTEAVPPSIRPAEFDRSIAVVVFTASETEMSSFDVRLGPCVQGPQQNEPLVSPLMQDGGELPAQTRALYTALTGQPDDTALTVVDAGDDGQLSVCSADFVAAMHNADEAMLRLADEDEARGDKDIPSFVAQQAALDQAWLAAANWPTSMVSTRNRLARIAMASLALSKDQPLYCWHGPSVPMRSLTMGQGPYPGR